MPEVGNVFSPDMAPGEASTMPAAEAIVIADEADSTTSSTAASKLKIIPPARETPIGLLRLEADVQPPITKVEFYLEDKLILARSRPPYTVEIDLGEVPRRQTVRAVGYDASGRLIDEDAWAINQGSARLAVKILPQPDPAAGIVRVKVVVQSISGGVAKQVELFLNDKKLKAWATSGPYEVTIPMTEYSPRRVPAGHGDRRGRQGGQRPPFPQGAEHDDRERARRRRAAPRFGRRQGQPLRQGPDGVRLLDPGGRPRPARDGLRGRREAAADDRPRRGRLRLDGEGHAVRARRLDRALPWPDPREGPGLRHRVPRAAADAPGADRRALSELQRAAGETSARGATSLFDSVVLGLYQFRALQGRKALVVVSDGADNHSHVDYQTLLRYCRSAGSPIYIIGVNLGVLDFGIRGQLNEIARESGGEVFYISNAEKIKEVTARIEEELRSQYIVAFRTDSQKPDGEYRDDRGGGRQARRHGENDQGIHPLTVASRCAPGLRLAAHRLAARGRRSTARLTLRCALAPAARTSSLPSVGRLSAPRTDAALPRK